MPAGRLPIFETPEQMQASVDAYFAERLEGKKPVTISGLSYHLGMSRETLCQYEKKDAFSSVAKRAKQRVEICLEERLFGSAATGTIFNLKNNFGWKDRTDHAHNGSIKLDHLSDEELDQRIARLTG